MTKTVIAAFFTVLGIAALLFLATVFYSAASQLVSFFTTVITEIQYW
jgi:hypothetical protein